MDKKYVLIKYKKNIFGGKMNVNILLKQIREERHLTLEQLSKMTNISKSHLNYIEKGERKVTIDVLCQIAIALNTDEKELYEVIK